MPTIVVCSSANFYRQAVEIEATLRAQGLEVVLPITAEKMKQSGDFDVSHYKTWFGDAKDYHKKATLIRTHFAEIVQGDAVLVLNYEKHGVANYIGGNVLMEMAIAFHLGKPIFVLNEAPEGSSLLEEVLGMEPVFLHGNVSNLAQKYAHR